MAKQTRQTKGASNARKEKAGAASAATERVKVKKLASPEPEKVKSPAPEKNPEPKTVVKAEVGVEKPAVKIVELVLGSTYTVRGVTFKGNRPMSVADPKILAAVEDNSRFKVTGA